MGRVEEASLDANIIETNEGEWLNRLDLDVVKVEGKKMEKMKKKDGKE